MVVPIILIQASESSPRLCVNHFSEKISTISTHVCVDQTNIYLGKTLECVTKHTLTTELPDSEREQLVHWNYIQQYMVANASSCWYMNGSDVLKLHWKIFIEKSIECRKSIQTILHSFSSISSERRLPLHHDTEEMM